jgi:CRP-like cAMP-binding protein
MTHPSLAMASSNRLLAMLSPATTTRLVSRMSRISVESRRALLANNRVHEAIYFPLDALAILSHADEHARTAGVALVGCDGVIGTGLLLGSAVSVHDAHAVIEGAALCMPRDAAFQELRQDAEFAGLMARYAHALLTQISFTSFCERVHSIEQRLIRWLLLARERTPHDGLTLSQETLARVIGVRREGVSVAAGKLQKAEIIRYQRGRIEIVDRIRLEALACQCYRQIRDEYSRLFTKAP